MTELSVRLNSLNVGSHRLDLQKMSPLHKQRAELSLSNYFSNRKIAIGEQKIPFHFTLDPRKSTLCLGDRQVVLEKSPELTDFNRVVRFYQNTGFLPKSEVDQNEAAESQKKSKEVVLAMQAASVPSTSGGVLAGIRIAEDTLSLTRNILFAIPSIGPDDPVVNHLGYYAGVFWTFFAFRELDSGWAEYKRSKLIGDKEGERRSVARVASGGIVSAASVIYLAGRIFDTLETSSAAMDAIGAANVLFGAGSLLAMGVSTLGAYRCHRFQQRLNEYLENPHLTEGEKFRGALNFLRDQITVTHQEREDLIAAIDREHPDWSQSQKAELLEQRVKNLTETKVKYLKRRTSTKSLQLIISQVHRLLDKLSDEKTEAEGIKEATLLLHTIQKENKTKMALFVLGFIAALISFIAMLAGTFFTAGALPFILYGIAGTIYLALSLYNVSILLSRKDTDGKLDLHPIQDIGPHEFMHPLI